MVSEAASRVASRSPVNNNSSPDVRVVSKAANRAVAVSKVVRIVRLSSA